MLSKSLKQLRPSPTKVVTPLNKIKSIVEQEEAKVSIDDLLPQGNQNATVRTQIFEAAIVFVAMAGEKLTSSSIKSVMSNDEFSKIAKSWTEALLQDSRNNEPLSEWYSNLGFPISKLGKFQDFIHENINDYYKITPSTFSYEGAQKENTADVVLIKNSTKSELMMILGEIKKLPDKEQILRAQTQSDGLITITSSKGKQISFYQVSAKKGVGDGRIGKVGAFINRNIIGATPNLPSSLLDLLKQEKYSHLSDRELELFTEGFFSDVINKFKTVATQGIKIFVNWVKGVFGKIYRTIAGNSQKDINKLINNKAMQAANNLLQKSRMSNLVEQKIKNDGRTKQELSLVKTLVKNINKVHTDNVRLVQRLNSRPKMKARPRQPILFVGAQTGLIDEGTIIKQLEKIEKQKDIAREDFKIAVTITSNFAANIAVNAILKNVEREVVKYEDLTESLFAFSSTLDAEARFGNTALPLVVCYGGQSGKNLVLGKRDDFTKTNANEMLQKGKQLNNFYVAVIEIDRVRGKDYNSASVHLVTGFKDENGNPFPIYQKMTIANSSGSKFTTKLEIDAFSPAKKVREWAA